MDAVVTPVMTLLYSRIINLKDKEDGFQKSGDSGLALDMKTI